MKSRITIAMISIGGVLGLGFVAFLANGVNEGRANAQRANFTAQELLLDVATGFADAEALPMNAPPANAAPAFFRGNATRAGGTTAYAPATVGQNGQYNDQQHRGLSVSSTQPIVVAIKNGPQLSGDTVNLDAFQLKTIFGTVSIPVNTITGLRMGDEARQPATICLSNGDSLTGELVTDAVTIKTAWGGATIGRDHITSIVTTTEPVTWQQHEGRWKIVLAEPVRNEAEQADSYEPNDEPAADQPPTFDPGAPATPATRSS